MGGNEVPGYPSEKPGAAGQAADAGTQHFRIAISGSCVPPQKAISYKPMQQIKWKPPKKSQPSSW